MDIELLTEIVNIQTDGSGGCRLSCLVCGDTCKTDLRIDVPVKTSKSDSDFCRTHWDKCGRNKPSTLELPKQRFELATRSKHSGEKPYRWEDGFGFMGGQSIQGHAGIGEGWLTPRWTAALFGERYKKMAFEPETIQDVKDHDGYEALENLVVLDADGHEGTITDVERVVRRDDEEFEVTIKWADGTSQMKLLTKWHNIRVCNRDVIDTFEYRIRSVVTLTKTDTFTPVPHPLIQEMRDQK